MLRTAFTTSFVLVPLGLLALASQDISPDNPPVWEVRVVNEGSEPVPTTDSSEPVWLFFQDFDASFQGIRVLFLNQNGNTCVGHDPVCESQTSFEVPPDRILLIDSVSVTGNARNGTLPAGMSAVLHMQILPGSFANQVHLGAADLTGDTGTRTWSKTYQTSVIVPAGAEVFGILHWTDSGFSEAFGNMTIIGRLVPVPVL